MVNIKQLDRQSPHLVIRYYHRPASNVRTEKAGWAVNDAEAHEDARIVHRVTNRDREEAYVIINVGMQTVVKNRFPESNEEVLNTYLARYRDTLKPHVDQWNNMILNSAREFLGHEEFDRIHRAAMEGLEGSDEKGNEDA